MKKFIKKFVKNIVNTIDEFVYIVSTNKIHFTAIAIILAIMVYLLTILF